MTFKITIKLALGINEENFSNANVISVQTTGQCVVIVEANGFTDAMQQAAGIVRNIDGRIESVNVVQWRNMRIPPK